MADTIIPDPCTEVLCQDQASRDAQNILLEYVKQIACNTTTSAGNSDYELLCSPDDGRPVVGIFTAGSPTQFFEIDGVTPYVGGTPTRCSGLDIEETTTCLQITVAGAYGAIGDRIKLIRWFDTSTNPPTEIAQVFINETTGAVVTGVNNTNSQPCGDLEYLKEEVELCAVVDNIPLYTAGDRILTQYVVEISSPLSPVLVAYKNLTDGSYPVPFYLQVNGVDLIGTPPLSTDFSSCSVVSSPEAPVIDAVPFLNASEISTAVTLHTFNVPVKSVSVWNGGLDYVLADFVTVTGTVGGNRQMIIPPGGSAQVGLDKDIPELIVEVELSTLGIVPGVTCPVIVNAAHPGRV